ncbi:MAG: hypothetical protein ABWX74_21105 [Aeromicrobium sp.]
MPRITLAFTLSGPQVQQDLVHEFSLHVDVTATVAGGEDSCVLLVETSDAPNALWEVRATIGMFDDRAIEMTDQA